MKISMVKLGSNEKGMALVVVLLVILVFAILGSAFIARTVNEKNTAEREKLLNQAFYIAESGADAGLAKLDELINVDLLNTVNSANPNVLGGKAENYATSNDGLGFLVAYVKNGGTPQLTLNGSQAEYISGNVAFGAGSYNYNVILTQKGNPVTIATDMWDFPFYYQIQSTASAQGTSRKVRIDGDLTVRVQRDNFAKFALFTDHHSLPNSTTVWFTSKTTFAGPLHTNERYSFAYNPSGIFDGVVTQHHNSARFYNNGFPFLADADANSGVDVPVFNAGYDRGKDEIVLASSVQKDDLAYQAKGGQTINVNGIYTPNSGGVLVGGIFVKGNTDITLGLDGSQNAKYTIVQGAVTKVITVDIPNNQTSVVTNGGPPVVYTGLPDGTDDLGTIIYVNGTINKLKGTVQKDTEITISSEFDINIIDHLKYQNYTPAVGTPGSIGYVPPNSDGEKNLLGLVAWGGNVNITTAAPANVEMHGIVMARNGIFQVNSYNNVGTGPRGTATLLGGVISQFYGAFGLYDTVSGALIAGYGRNFVYDTRTLLGKAPPYFPSMKTFVAFTNDLVDKVSYQEGGF